MVSSAAGASAAAAVLLFLVARRWDGRLSVLLNLIFLFVGAPNFRAVCDDADPAMATHVEVRVRVRARARARAMARVRVRVNAVANPNPHPHPKALREKHAKGMAPLPTVEG